ncbi:PREDICTED: uncharacterized protein LOC109243995 [Nicotiana attenuata]|uniref:uncharacterized protein LOC109243995 n=1 Tax=Nicotiana attenuata TaxID=49451 RepID=UPI0009053A16|nr:PREDICTED: uncharacterized protein LOC109243995 [Nicotiana attenuata]
MVNVSILIQYNGDWQDSRRYVKFDAEGIFINLCCNFEELVTTISKQIKVLEDGMRYVVDMNERTCTCRRFQKDEMPWPHALAVVTKEGMSAYEYCSVYFSIDYMVKNYEQMVFPMPDESNWDIPREISEEVVLPPVG